MSTVINVDTKNRIEEALIVAEGLYKNGETGITIRIAPGVYHEKLEIKIPGLMIEGAGYSPDDVVISYDDFANDLMEDGEKRGTFRSYTMFIDADGVCVSNLTIENVSGDEKEKGQALALYADGDALYFENVNLKGRQDTLFTGPLPPNELKLGGFVGPKEFAPRRNGRHYYKNCYICGNVDFIFGSATCFFESCTIESLSHKDDPSEIQGWITAGSTPEGQDYGYVFSQCDFISSECAPETVYLGRPWRNFAKTVFLECTFGPHIHMDGFHDWRKPEAHDTVLYATYHCIRFEPTGMVKAFVPAADFARELSADEAAKYDRNLVFAKA